MTNTEQNHQITAEEKAAAEEKAKAAVEAEKTKREAQRLQKERSRARVAALEKKYGKDFDDILVDVVEHVFGAAE